MKRISLVVVVFAVLGLLFTGCSDTSTGVETVDSLEKVREAGKLVVGLDDAFPPMGFRDNDGNIVGFDVDLAQEAARRLGVEVEYSPIDWDSKIMELNSGNIDVIWNGLTITEERKEKMAFTAPYIEDKQILVVLGSSVIECKTDLAGKKVGVQMGSSSMDALEKDSVTFKSIKEVVQYPNNNEALMDLEIGRIDAVVVDEVVGRYYMSKRTADYVVLSEHFGLEEFGVGLRKQDTSLAEALEQAIEEMKEDGTASAISVRWFGEDIIK